MDLEDSCGLTVTGASPDALERYESACHQFRCYIGDPVATVEQALEAGDGMPMAHALKAWLHLLGTEPAGLPVARECLNAVKGRGMTPRECGHFKAIELAGSGEWRAAGRVLEELSSHYPRDGLALQAGHLVDFLVGDSRMLRDRPARVFSAWTPGTPGRHAVLGMYAFGLEECGEYAQAEKYGRESVELEPRDGWGWHSVAHVMEMQGRTDEGIAWLRGHSDAWSRESFFAVHNWWHLALYHLEQGNAAEALALFDGPVFGARSQVVLDLVDATALLWRLNLLGVDVGDRWNAVADRWAAVDNVGDYAFNAWHAMMAFVGADRVRAQTETLNSLKVATLAEGDVALFAAEIGLGAAQAVLAFGAGRCSEALELLRPLRSHAHRFGGSHAQRDLIDLTMIEAAMRSGRRSFAEALVAERAHRRPGSMAVKWLTSRLGSEQ